MADFHSVLWNAKTSEIQLVSGLNALYLCTLEPSYVSYMDEKARKKPHFQEMRRFLNK